MDELQKLLANLTSISSANSTPLNSGTTDFSSMISDSLYGDMSGLSTPVSTGVGTTISNGSPTTPNTGFGFNSNTFNTVGQGLNALSSIANAYTGIKGLGLSEDTFNFNKSLTETNLANSANLTNEALATRQATRLRSQGITGDANASAVSDFMNQYGVSGTVGG